VRQIVRAIDGRNIKFVHISTDNVFDGRKGDYGEEDAVNPINVYGRTKYEGEQEALKAPQSLVVRTNIFGWNVQYKYSLAEWCLNELSQGHRIKGFTDVYFSSLYTIDLAKIIREAMARDLRGVFHMAASSVVSKYRFLVDVAELFGFNASLIEPITLEEFPFKAKRGRNISMAVSKGRVALGITIPTVEESLRHFYFDYPLKIGVLGEN
jgi:dTDP-4-dehydrorhamnose reductase